MLVYVYHAPKLTSYVVMEDRSTMEQPLNFEEMHQSFIFGFFDTATTSPVTVDPKYGSFKLSISSYYWEDGQMTQSESPLSLVPLSQKPEEEK